jgi:hypothetical protein
MELRLHSVDEFRVSTMQGSNFIDVRGLPNEAGIQVNSYPHFHYIEVRRKMGQVATFHFKNKRWKKETDLGWWNDAEVVFSVNEVEHK